MGHISKIDFKRFFKYSQVGTQFHCANLAESMKFWLLVNIYLKNRFGRVPKNLDQGPPLIWPKNDPKWPKTIKNMNIPVFK